MNNFFIILFHTYLSKLKTKSFLVTTILTAVIIITLTNIPRIIEFFEKDGDVETVAVIDTSGQLFQPLEEQVKLTDQDFELTLVSESIVDVSKRWRKENMSVSFS